MTSSVGRSGNSWKLVKDYVANLPGALIGAVELDKEGHAEQRTLAARIIDGLQEVDHYRANIIPGEQIWYFGQIRERCSPIRGFGSIARCGKYSEGWR